MQKKYWLRGLITGIIIYALVVLVVFVTDKGEMAGIVTAAIVAYFSPVILVCLLIGWLYGKIKNRNI
ncbi:MAG: hypothetical protein US45_C0061G0006 [Candidatus Nomurabacteria bacterium GW2011_GWA1_37_20]|uniref:Uncharacterized protein n=1 Tax=Candidatus Nomurabacteria bacterium GW2011_GWA1_37_20 TaxID=1618729 RepID=A0A0G0GHE4_9BACT|nr:MAG: hypothetical protein US33_C0039G0008 [Parcubacteria group bacterium GW2011_GWC1_36_9]KKQ25498.1 MAG: hypothetical protein US41_C0043G0008 [Parcubacteria group bacterium GW2011_GWB1_37_13]KKQ29382.1 MAG: hypothetical protein US45_C0061G0006 [Candidatus Nomurabacteria bacterium GW2011_GWA1_37_20]